MSVQSSVDRHQDPVTKAFHITAIVTEEDMKRVLEGNREDKAYIDFCFGLGSTPPMWLQGFARLFSRMRSKQTIR